MERPDLSGSGARYQVEARDPNGKMVRADVVAGEIRVGCRDLGRSFDERTRRTIIETAQRLGGSVRSIKRID